MRHSSPAKRTAVITRTRNRPIFLQRAAESLASQTDRDFLWVIVNDAGEKNDVNKIAAKAEKDGLDVIVLHKPVSCGIEAAANFGIQNSQSCFILIHDDDDTLKPDFLQRMTKYLLGNPSVGGAVSWVNKVSEAYDQNEIMFMQSRPYVFLPKGISLKSLGVCNQFPPICFLYRRTVYDSVAGYNEALRVLGDWDFNLRVAEQFPLGVVKRRLANYHMRTNATGDAANTIIRDKTLHETQSKKIRAGDMPGYGQSIKSALQDGEKTFKTLKARPGYRLRSMLLKMRDNVLAQQGR